MRKLKFKQVSICKEFCEEVRVDLGCLSLSVCLSLSTNENSEVIGKIVCRDDIEESELK